MRLTNLGKRPPEETRLHVCPACWHTEQQRYFWQIPNNPRCKYSKLVPVQPKPCPQCGTKLAAAITNFYPLLPVEERRGRRYES